MYYIHHAGVWYDFGTKTDAIARAEYIFAQEGVIVSIVDKLPTAQEAQDAADAAWLNRPDVRAGRALQNVLAAVRDTAPSGRIAVSKVERIIRNEIAAQRERG